MHPRGMLVWRLFFIQAIHKGNGEYTLHCRRFKIRLLPFFHICGLTTIFADHELDQSYPCHFQVKMISFYQVVWHACVAFLVIPGSWAEDDYQKTDQRGGGGVVDARSSCFMQICINRVGIKESEHSHNDLYAPIIELQKWGKQWKGHFYNILNCKASTDKISNHASQGFWPVKCAYRMVQEEIGKSGRRNP